MTFLGGEKGKMIWFAVFIFRFSCKEATKQTSAHQVFFQEKKKKVTRSITVNSHNVKHLSLGFKLHPNLIT